jgi:hypothetical protein
MIRAANITSKIPPMTIRTESVLTPVGLPALLCCGKDLRAANVLAS